MKGDVAQSSEVMSLAGGEGGSAAVYGLDSKPAEGAQPAEALYLAKRQNRLHRKP